MDTIIFWYKFIRTQQRNTFSILSVNYFYTSYSIRPLDSLLLLVEKRDTGVAADGIAVLLVLIVTPNATANGILLLDWDTLLGHDDRTICTLRHWSFISTTRLVGYANRFGGDEDCVVTLSRTNISGGGTKLSGLLLGSVTSLSFNEQQQSQISPTPQQLQLQTSRPNVPVVGVPLLTQSMATICTLRMRLDLISKNYKK